MIKLADLPHAGHPQDQTITYDRSTPLQLFDAIYEEIVSMQLLPGEKIPETQLAEKFGVSRTPVRSALARLAALGFVEIRPQRGTYVTKLSMHKILEARFIREALEVAVACHLAQHADDQLIAACEKIVEAQMTAAQESDALKFQKLDDLFHATLAAATGFDRVPKVVEAEKAHMDRVRNLSLIQLSGQYDQVIVQHQTILAAIKSGSENDAKNAMQTHMKDVFNILKIAPEQHPEYFE